MKNIQSIRLAEDGGEELLPGFSPDFPYIATCAELYKYCNPDIPWHWHRTVELFYMESGTLEYRTPHGKWVFPAGSGGFVNSNILHTTRIIPSGAESVQLLHLFEPELISGNSGSRIDVKYVRPLIGSGNIELLPLFPDDPEQAALLRKIRAAFDLKEESWGYELSVRSRLTDIWMDLLKQAKPLIGVGPGSPTEEKMKAMLLYIQEHYRESFTVEQLAEAVHISRRVCFRLFAELLNMTPVEYLTDYRLHRARQLLEETEKPVTEIACACGLGSGSYFGKLFREHYGCPPAQYRRKWHECNKNQHG